ncbi:FAD-binding oxidoreductase [Kitasatospora sp. DSM 101779]|uniref:FAD-binding oxidoreductase n=1 Tax=Kitasatospora sp. DSM 101779 TaxID=2853165 RepID=UPI0021DA7FE2|nr:FAD-binding oxidoreductase [Kitasatospora sp. DSM 101779]MCU7825011.1 FAD-binding oxidoreductase [Kitasatospora sp. DSM 101779]
MASPANGGLRPEELAEGFAGRVLLPGDEAYGEARTIHNAMIDRRPAVIAQCDGPADVAAALAFGRSRGLEIAVRCGGHAVSGQALVDGGLVLDLRRMNGVQVDPDARVARVGGGALMRDLDRATQPHGLATTGGRASTTGIGGFALGGGSGWLERRFGLMCDNLLAADLVTADGRRVHASAQENPELFWALHGGGGNFGVVTEFTFGLHPLPGFSIALLLFEAAKGLEVLRAYRDAMDAAPDEVGGAFIHLTAPPEEFVPPALVGQHAVGVLLTYAGDLESARPAFAPMLGLGHAADVVTDIPYVDLQCMLDDPPGFRNYWSAEYLSGFPDKAADAYTARAQDMIVPSPSQHIVFPLGGAVAAAGHEWPVPWRAASWAVHPFAVWEDPADDERGRSWTKAVCADMAPWSIGAVYLNFIGDEGEDRAAAGRGAENLARLAAVKAEYDPANVFHFNHNIRPAA